MNQYNLLDEKWLVVMAGETGETEEVSLTDLFNNAHKYKRLAGETPTQDFAVLRFLLSILHTVFTRFTVTGDPYEWIILDPDSFQVKEEVDEVEEEDLYKTWKILWKKGKFPDIVNEYLEKYHHRFYLLDDQYPFFQFPTIGEPEYPYNATDYGINKLNGKILEGDPRKPRLFMSQYQTGLEYSAAARWLLYINGYAPSKSGNPGKKKKRESTGVAYLGKLGGIYASGKNLFETLLLNFNLPDNTCVQKPIWEVEPQIENFQMIPDNLAQLLTYPSRQLLLKSNEENQIIEYRLDLAISNFEYAPNLTIEPFTFWKYDTKLDMKKWKIKEGYIPKRHNPDKYFWQEMQTFSAIEDNSYNPGIIEWLRKLQGDDLVNGLVSLNAVAENYIQKDGVVDRQIYDQISENIGLLDKQENGWLIRIADEIKNTEHVINNTIIRFAKDIDKIRNLQNSVTELKVKREIYFSIDSRFREWLVNITPSEDKNECMRKWRVILREQIIQQGNDLIQGAGNRDYLGNYSDKKVENIETVYLKFRANLKKELG